MHSTRKRALELFERASEAFLELPPSLTRDLSYRSSFAPLLLRYAPGNSPPVDPSISPPWNGDYRSRVSEQLSVELSTAIEFTALERMRRVWYRPYLLVP